MNRHWQYLKYILRHKYLVYYYGRKLFGLSRWQLLRHDLSKFSREEWTSYVNKFFSNKPFSPLDDYELMFSYGWNQHQKFNKHHWQYWLLIKNDGVIDPLEIPIEYIYEMVADWIAVGYVLGGSVWDWWAANKDKIVMHERSKSLVDVVIDRVKTEMYTSYLNLVMNK